MASACELINYEISEKEKLAKNIKFVSGVFGQIFDNGEIFKNKMFLDLTQMFEGQVVGHANYVKQLYNFDAAIKEAKSGLAKDTAKDIVDLRIQEATEAEFTKRVKAINEGRNLDGLAFARWSDTQPKYIQELAQSMKNLKAQLVDSAARLKLGGVDTTKYIPKALDGIDNFFRLADGVNTHLQRQYGSSFYKKAERLNPDLKTFLESEKTFGLDVFDMAKLRYILGDDTQINKFSGARVEGFKKSIVQLGKYKKVTSLFTAPQFVTQAIQYAVEIKGRTKTMKGLTGTKEDVKDLLSLMYNNGFVSDSANLISNVGEGNPMQVQGFLKNFGLIDVNSYLNGEVNVVELGKVIFAYFDAIRNLGVSNPGDIIEMFFDPVIKGIGIQEAAISKYGSVSNFWSIFRKSTAEEQRAMMKQVADSANTNFIPNLKGFISDKYAINKPTSGVGAAYMLFNYMGGRGLSLMKRTLRDTSAGFFMMFHPYDAKVRAEGFQRVSEGLLPAVESVMQSTYYRARANRIDREAGNSEEKNKSMTDRVLTYRNELSQFSSRAAATQANFFGRIMTESLKRIGDQDFGYQITTKVLGEFGRQLGALSIPVDILDTIIYTLQGEIDGQKIQDTVFERWKGMALKTFASAVPYAINRAADEDESVFGYTAYKQGNVSLMQKLGQISSYKEGIGRLSELTYYAKYKDVAEHGNRLDIVASLGGRNAIKKVYNTVKNFLKDSKYSTYQDKADRTLLGLLEDKTFKSLVDGEGKISDMAEVMQKVSGNAEKGNKALMEVVDIALDSDYHKYRENDAKGKGVTIVAENLRRAVIKDGFGEKGEFNYDSFIKFLQNTSSDDIQKLGFATAQLGSEAPGAGAALLSYLTENLKKGIGNGDIMFFPEDGVLNGVPVKKGQLISEKAFGLSKGGHRIVSNGDGTFSIDKFKKSETPADLNAEAKLALADNLFPLLKTVNRPAYNAIIGKYADAKGVNLNGNLGQFATAYLEQMEATYNGKTPDFARLNELTTMLGSIYRENKSGKALSEGEKDQQSKEIAGLKLSLFSDISDFVKSSPLDDASKTSTLIQVFKSNEDIITEVLENPDLYKDYKDIATRAAGELYGNNAFIQERAKSDIASAIDKATGGSGGGGKGKAQKVAKIKDIDIANAIKFNNNYHELLSNAAKNKVKEAGSVFTNSDRMESDYLRGTAKGAVSAISTDRYTVKGRSGNIGQLSIPGGKRSSSSAKRKSSKKTSRKIVLY